MSTGETAIVGQSVASFCRSRGLSTKNLHGVLLGRRVAYRDWAACEKFGAGGFSFASNTCYTFATPGHKAAPNDPRRCGGAVMGGNDPSSNVMKAHQQINQTSGDVEYYTPPAIIAAATLILGTIDLDPASSAAANERVKSIRIFTEDDDGLAQEWHGKVWMNHPFGKKVNSKWISKLEEEYQSGRVQEALCLTYACTSEKWFQPLLQRPQCFLCPRTNYYLPDGSVKKGVTKGSVVTYFGEDDERFAEAFASLGVVKI